MGATEWALAEALFFEAYPVILALWLAFDSGCQLVRYSLLGVYFLRCRRSYRSCWGHRSGRLLHLSLLADCDDARDSKRE